MSLRAKAWYTKYQQGLPTIREKRLPSEVERAELYGTMAQVGLAINAIDCLALTTETRNIIADWLGEYQIPVDQGQTYMESSYSFGNNYVIFQQDV